MCGDQQRATGGKRKRAVRPTQPNDTPKLNQQQEKTPSDRLAKSRRSELPGDLGTKENPINVEVDENEQLPELQRPLEDQERQQKPIGQEEMEALDSDDYFEVLGLARGCSEAEIKRAYRKLAVLWHPDKNRSHPKAEEYFKKIGEAYAVLSDPDKRAKYEAFGKAGLNNSRDNAGSAAGAEFDDGGFGFAGHAGFSARHARDIFEAFFGGTDPFAELFGGFGGTMGGSQRRRTVPNRQQRGGFGFGMMDDDMGFGSPVFGSPMGFGGGGIGSVMDSFFGNGFGNGFANDVGGDGCGFMSSMNFSSLGGGGSFTSVSSSSFTDQNGHFVTKKTITTTDANGRPVTKTEEYRNGNLVNSTSSPAPSRLAGAGRMQLESTIPTDNPVASRGQSSQRQGSASRASSRSRPRY